MKRYWTISSIQELQTVPKVERRKIWRRAFWKSFLHWQTWGGLAICAVCVILGKLVGGKPGMYVGVALGSFVFSQIAINMAIPHIQEIKG